MPLVTDSPAYCRALAFTWVVILILSFASIIHPVEASSQAMRPAPPVQSDEPSPRIVEAVRTQGQITVDGVLDEEAWANAEPFTRFVQRDPDQGAEPTERTAVYVIYDEEALYVGARMYDSTPDSIVARLGRRDAHLESDYFMVFLDPYHDRRSGYYFGVNAAGTLYDGILLNDDWDDSDWDGVWQARAAIDEEGWTAEIRIPYSQLRFYQQERYVWGIDFKRVISRKNEQDYLVYTPRNESGFVSRFWDLVGIEGIQPKRQIEVIPYVTSRALYDETASDNPFHDGSRYGLDAGADVRAGLTPNLTLNATVNPDFGQVEVDPAVINLSDVETYFPEKRPFFIEGASNFTNFGRGGANSNWGFNWGNPEFFYSRRVGRAPAGILPEHDFSDAPDGTRILGAAKVTGKVAGSWNIGTVHAMTAREHADLQLDGRRFGAAVEPATYYGVLRAQKEFQEGRQGLGFLSTATNRFFTGDRLEDQMNRNALAMGVDGWTSLDRDETWVVNGWGGLSSVRGTRERMLELQQSSMHYFQRPDAGHVEIDSTATSMTGWAGRLAVNKQRGRIAFNSALGVISPSFDLNDVGFQWRSDMINGHIAGGYSWPDPGRFTRSAAVIGAVFGTKDFDGNTVWAGLWGRSDIEFLNYYEASAFVALNPETINNRRTRGGPLTLNPPGMEAGIMLESDSRKDLVVGLEAGMYVGGDGPSTRLGVELEWKPAASISVSATPSVRWNYEDAQWVGVYEDPLATETFGRRYVFADLEQMTLSSSFRVSWTFSPVLSFQLYAQPLLSIGDYGTYKELARPRTFDFNVYGKGESTFDPESRLADPDGSGPAEAIELPQLDFNFTSLRGTAVLRWEYRPGSTLYLVWTQRRSDGTEDPEFRFGPSLDQLWHAPMENVFVLKLTYWLSR